MRTLRKASIRAAIAATAFAASAFSTAGIAVAAPGDYCQYVDGTVYCGVEENIVEGDPGLSDCIRRWERASWTCP